MSKLSELIRKQYIKIIKRDRKRSTARAYSLNEINQFVLNVFHVNELEQICLFEKLKKQLNSKCQN
jgi:hypothetical protein